eukprot:CAMPEP_0169062534 /NCGR_PEP_ID=MMETSP1015-20121227/741_2 /TAXON_ID=342587 /ORGANISM="Karlodinium micrum, Strain CCMP2283" /LENGTH=104 /DNA_ID=CAMNT_0009120687 /DNA_START=493 /DNA_END=808 /DNA_ORIENTATION=-
MTKQKYFDGNKSPKSRRFSDEHSPKVISMGMGLLNMIFFGKLAIAIGDDLQALLRCSKELHVFFFRIHSLNVAFKPHATLEPSPTSSLAPLDSNTVTSGSISER